MTHFIIIILLFIIKIKTRVLIGIHPHIMTITKTITLLENLVNIRIFIPMHLLIATNKILNKNKTINHRQILTLPSKEKMTILRVVMQIILDNGKKKTAGWIKCKLSGQLLYLEFIF